MRRFFILRADRIIVGEIRGPEAIDMIQAMNTGHDGSLSTGHANSVRDMLSRIETMVMMGTEIPLQAIRKQIASSIDIVIQLARLRDRSRRIVEIAEIVDCQNGEIIINSLFEFKEYTEMTEQERKEGKFSSAMIRETGEYAQYVQGSLVRTGNKLIRRRKLRMANIQLTL